MTAIEMFAGIGGFRLGLEKAGFQVIWANDIDPKACAVYSSHFGDGSIVYEDIRNVKDSIPDHKLLSAGFPCQPFSAAGKKLGVHDLVRGSLFAEIVDVLEKQQPDFFILENVKRLLTMENGNHFRTILRALTRVGYLVEWRLLNAKHFGLAQNRERVFLVGHRSLSLGDHNFSSFCRNHAALFLESDVPMDNTLFNSVPVSELSDKIDNCGKFGFAGFAYGSNVVSYSLSEFPDQVPMKLLQEVLETDPDLKFDFTESTSQWIKNNTEVNSFIHGVEILSNQEGGRRMGYTIFGTRGIAPTLTATPSRHYERYKVGDKYRRLTNVEYARLQGFSDDWCRLVTTYDQYALFGNAVPPVLVEWVSSRVAARMEQRRMNERSQETKMSVGPQEFARNSGTTQSVS